MATTDWDIAHDFQGKFPHTYNALQVLVMAMADYTNNKNKKTFFGIDRGLTAYKKFEDALRDTILAMVVDGVIVRSVGAKECREKLMEMIIAWSGVFPNWQDAYSFAGEYFVDQAEIAEARIGQLLSQ